LPEETIPEEVNAYIQNDPFAQHMGAQVEITAPGHSRVSMTVTEEMINFHGMTHGAVVFALSDMAFAVASNSHGQTAVALNCSISFLRATKSGDRLVAEAHETSASRRTALYDITVRDKRTGDLVAKSQNLVYRRNEWFAGPQK
jgi:acyl-CoA thioesterase